MIPLRGLRFIFRKGIMLRLNRTVADRNRMRSALRCEHNLIGKHREGIYITLVKLFLLAGIHLITIDAPAVLPLDSTDLHKIADWNSKSKTVLANAFNLKSSVYAYSKLGVIVC